MGDQTIVGLPVAVEGAGTIGPNSVTQLGNSVAAILGNDARETLFRMAGLEGLLLCPPENMIDESIPNALFRALWQIFPETASDMAAEAGRRTADYVIENRIPRFVQMIMRVAPRYLSAQMLMQAIRKNAWTFVGSGHCQIATQGRLLITISDNPLVMPDCVWHAAVFERLFERLVANGTTVNHTDYCSGNTPVCRFEIRLPTS